MDMERQKIIWWKYKYRGGAGTNRWSSSSSLLLGLEWASGSHESTIARAFEIDMSICVWIAMASGSAAGLWGFVVMV
jgi:hypothetical protein